MNIKNTFAGLAAAGSMMIPSQAEAEADVGAKLHHEDTHTHPHHIAIGPEVDAHKAMGHILYTHELFDHWSAGVGLGLGAAYHGKMAGSAEAVGTFHDSIANPFYVVGELGVGAEWIGTQVAPIARITTLVGIRLSKTLGFAVGPSVLITPNKVQPAITSNLAIGF